MTDGEPVTPATLPACKHCGLPLAAEDEFHAYSGPSGWHKSCMEADDARVRAEWAEIYPANVVIGPGRPKAWNLGALRSVTRDSPEGQALLRRRAAEQARWERELGIVAGEGGAELLGGG